METIWKYPLAVDDVQAIRMPVGAEVLAVQSQGDLPCMWAKVDPNADEESRLFYTRGTGHPFSGQEGRHVGTYQMHGGGLVFHVFEAKP